MGTPSSITTKCNDGKFRSTYCQYDGYPSYNGKILFEHFQDQQKIEDMMALGDMSSLGASIECPDGHSYDTPVEGHTLFYGRDRRGEQSSVDCLVCKSEEKCLEKNDQAYNYFWDGEKWFVDGNLLTEKIIAED